MVIKSIITAYSDNYLLSSQRVKQSFAQIIEVRYK